jgi:hypothetical protein
MSEFSPTWLYVKIHNVTGLKYLGKTTQDPYSYGGSGRHWISHINKHGKDITTLWAYKYTDQSILKEEALFFSKVYNVVNSKEWANKMIEDGATGGKTFNRTPEHNALMSVATKGKKMPPGFSDKIRNIKTGKKMPDGFGNLMSTILSGVKKPEGFGEKISDALTGTKKSAQHKSRLSESVRNLPKLQCPHCGTMSSPGNHKRWHRDNCKEKQ